MPCVIVDPKGSPALEQTVRVHSGQVWTLDGKLPADLVDPRPWQVPDLPLGGTRAVADLSGAAGVRCAPMDDQVFVEQQRVREDLENLAGRMGHLARLALDAPTNVEVAQAWLERADIVSRLVESIPVIDEHQQVRALQWRPRRRG